MKDPNDRNGNITDGIRKTSEMYRYSSSERVRIVHSIRYILFLTVYWLQYKTHTKQTDNYSSYVCWLNWLIKLGILLHQSIFLY